MRQETQRWDSVKLTAEIVIAGAGQTGLAPTVAVRDINTGNWLQVGGASFAPGFAVNPMTEVDAVNLPGAYEYSLLSTEVQAGFLAQGGHKGYYAKVVETVTNLLEYAHIDILPAPNGDKLNGGRTYGAVMDAVFRVLVSTEDDLISGYTAGAGSAGDKFYSVQPGAAASARYVNRLAVLHDDAAGNGEVSVLLRIGGIFTDGGGDYFLLQNPDGTSYAGGFGGVGTTLYVKMQEATARVSSVETDAITASSVAASATSEIAGAVWDEPTASHVTAGTFGKATGDLSGLSALTIADAVWDEPIGDHSGVAGSTAESLFNISTVAIADAVWDELLAGHTAVGSSGEAMTSAGAGATPTAIASAVWEDATASHVTAGTMGRALVVAQGLVQANHRMKSPTYDPNGRLLSSQLVIYPTGTDATNDTNAIATYTVTATYDINGNMSTFLSAE